MFIKKMMYASYMPILIIANLTFFYSGALQRRIILATDKKNISIKDNLANTKPVTGTARVMINANQPSKVCKGDIIVVAMTDISWEPILSLAAAIVTDEGDANCHTALFGKRMDIPVVVGTKNGTEIIVDGQAITVDGMQGLVYDASGDMKNEITGTGAMSINNNRLIVMHSSSDSGHSIKKTDSCVAIQAVDELPYQNKKQKNKLTCSAQQLYGQHYHEFKDYVLGMKSELWWGRRTGTVEWGARKVRKYNEFTISCIPLSYPFFDHSEKTIIRILELIGNKKYIDLVESLIERCKKKPNHVKVMDWIAQVSHEEHVKNITLPPDARREQLIADPKKYQKYVEEGKVPAEERDALIATGLFVRYLVEQELI